MSYSPSRLGPIVAAFLFPLSLGLSSCASSKKDTSHPGEERDVLLMETPDPIGEEDRTSADALRESEPDPRQKKKSRSSPKISSTGGENSTPRGGKSEPPKQTEKVKPAGGLAKVGPPTPLPADKDLGQIGLKILFMDVGQADAILIVGPKASLLIDAGEVTQKQKKSQNFNKIAAKIYELTGRNHIDYFSPSHYHVDHMGSARWENGIFGLVDSGISIGAIIDRGDVFFGEPRPGGWKGYPEAVQSWIEAGMVGKRVTAQLGVGQIDLGEGITVEVVAVNSNGVLEKKNEQNPGYFDKCPPSENDYSIAFKISVGEFEFFTGGDLTGADVARQFGKDCQSYNDVETFIAANVGDVELFKATHHGSEHSNNKLFLDTLDPEVSIIPSGGGYNHPAQDVARRLAATSITLDTGGFSEKEWPSGPPADIPVVGDVLVEVTTSGAYYRVQHASGSQIHRSYSDAEEAKELDQKNAPLTAISQH